MDKGGNPGLLPAYRRRNGRVFPGRGDQNRKNLGDDEIVDRGKASMKLLPLERETHFLRAFTSERDDIPIGIVGLNSVDRTFKTAMFWGHMGVCRG